MKWLSVLMAALFLFAVAVQYNDPDGLLWMVAYGFVVVLTVVSISGRHPWRMGLLLFVALLAWGVFLAPSIGQVSLDSFTRWSMHGNDEIVREVGGLSFAAIWTLVLTVYDWRRAKRLS